MRSGRPPISRPLYSRIVDATSVAAALRAARLAAGLTQVRLAERIGTTQTAVARAESGKVMPTIGLADRWARATGRPMMLRLGNGPDIAPSGVDRDQLRHQLGLTPDARLRGLTNTVQFIARQRPRLRARP